MAKEKKNFVILIIGIIILVVGIVFLVKGIQQYSQANADYQVAYDKWYTDWWVNHTATLNDMPEHPHLPVFLIMGPFGIVLGIGLTIAGIGFAFGKETEDILKENSTNVTNIFEEIKDASKPKNRVCKYCGNENKPEATKCSSCGAALSDKN